MKIYSVPEAVPYAEPDYDKYDFQVEQARIEQHIADLKTHLVAMGYKGKHTGKVVRFPVADGYAQYMLADGKGRYGSSFLIHLPYVDSYQYAGVEYMPKKAIIEQILHQEKIDELFRKHAPG